MTKTIKPNVQCDVCGSMFKNISGFSRHRKQKHLDAPKLARGTAPDIQKLELIAKTKPIGKAKCLTRKFACFGPKHVGAKKQSASVKRQ